MKKYEFVKLNHLNTFGERVINSLFEFMSRFVSADDYRANTIGDIFYDAESGNIVSTDGKCLAVMSIKQGIFDDVKEIFGDKSFKIQYLKKEKAIILKGESTIFANYKNVMPSIEDKKESNLSLGGSNPDANYPCFYILTRVRINLEYLKRLKGFEWKVYCSDDKNKGVVFKNETYNITVVIMPMQMVEEE